MTSTLEQVEKLLQMLSPSERAIVARWVQDDASYRFPGIEKTLGVCGGSACIVRTRIPVWLLVEAQQAGATEADLLQSYPSLRAEDLLNAWAYYRANKEEIESEILENEAV
ncbi:MAG: DUF433 domain-containing protein [Saprospiraceae bacterium]|nr:DUF433 domain-containing protein [Saprospiraceae bacterium]